MNRYELCSFMDSLRKLAGALHDPEANDKRVGRIIIPTAESRSILEDYISRWAWLIVQKGSEIEEAPEDTPQIAEADSKLTFRDAVLEMVLYGLAYLFDKDSYGVDPIYGLATWHDADYKGSDN